MKEVVNYLWNTPYQQLQTQFLVGLLFVFFTGLAVWLLLKKFFG